MFASIRYAAVATLVAVVPAAANAAPAASFGQPKSVEVHYADLNLASDAGSAELARRVARATRQVCDIADPRDAAGSRLIRACRAETMANARTRMETAVAAARTDNRLASTGGSPSLHIAAH